MTDHSASRRTQDLYIFNWERESIRRLQDLVKDDLLLQLRLDDLWWTAVRYGRELQESGELLMPFAPFGSVAMQGVSTRPTLPLADADLDDEE